MAFKTAASNLSLRQLRAFLCVAEEASMTRAAARLHLGHAPELDYAPKSMS